MTDYAIQVTGLCKSYQGRAAVDGVDLDVRRGEVFSLLGPNGAGKTTTVEILEGYRRRDAGEVRVLGDDPAVGSAAWKSRIGIVLQRVDDLAQSSELTVREWVGATAAYFPDPRPVDETIELVGLGDKRQARASSLSGGQRRRLDVALGIVGRPDLLFLDEPTTGFDPAARRNAWGLIRELCSGGTTVLLTTHYLDEAEHLADRVGVLNGGRLVAEGTPTQLVGGGVTRVGFVLPAGVGVEEVRGAVPSDAVVVGDRVEFTTTTPTAAVHAVTGWALDRGHELVGLTVERPSLEDVFLALAAEAPAP